MKVLFAVSNDKISEQIAKKYQQDYKEIISSKNVYYFNAIIKELQKDKSYDRIVISEDLEMFSTNNYREIDKFIFEKLDNISDEAVNNSGIDIPIILICTDRRNKFDPLMLKIFGIGIYSALLGQDRSIQKVCDLIRKPRSKKEAKIYYRVESSEIEYKAENDENGVNELEIRNIIAHYKKIGNNPEKCVESFKKIKAQYTGEQLKLILPFLPMETKQILEQNSTEYLQAIGKTEMIVEKSNNSVPSENSVPGFVERKISSNTGMSNPVIIPTQINSGIAKKIKQENVNPVDRYAEERARRIAEKKAKILAQRKVEQEKKRKEEAQAKAEAKRIRIESEKKAAQERIRMEQIRKQEEELQKKEAERKAKIAKEKRIEAEKRAEDEKIRQEVVKKAKEERLRKEAERKAEEERLKKEAERKAEEERLRKEAERKIQEEILKIELAKKAEEEKFRIELQKQAAETEKLKKQLEQRVAETEKMKKEAKEEVAKQEKLRKEAEIKAAEEEKLRKEAESKAKEEILKMEAAKKTEEDRLRKIAAEKAEERIVKEQNEEKTIAKRRGRPRKNLEKVENMAEPQVKRKRGRPRKEVIEESAKPEVIDKKEVEKVKIVKEKTAKTLEKEKDDDIFGDFIDIDMNQASEQIEYPEVDIAGFDDDDSNIKVENNNEIDKDNEEIEDEVLVSGIEAEDEKLDLEEDEPHIEEDLDFEDEVSEDEELELEEDDYDIDEDLDFEDEVLEDGELDLEEDYSDIEEDLEFGDEVSEDEELDLEDDDTDIDEDLNFGDELPDDEELELEEDDSDIEEDLDFEDEVSDNDSDIDEDLTLDDDDELLPGFEDDEEFTDDEKFDDTDNSEDESSDDDVLPKLEDSKNLEDEENFDNTEYDSEIEDLSDFDDSDIDEDLTLDDDDEVLPGFDDDEFAEDEDFATADEELISEDEDLDEADYDEDFGDEFDVDENTVQHIMKQDTTEIRNPNYKPGTIIPVGINTETPNNFDSIQANNNEKNLVNTKIEKDLNIDNLITGDKKIVSFVGTSKNGTSFIINNLAKMFSDKGIKTAILDLTQNRNSYYIYTENEEELRKRAFACLGNLTKGIAEGIEVNKNLSVYTSLPGETQPLNQINETLETLLNNYSLILLDCDFETESLYFKAAQEIYLVQTFDVLTIQPLTAFLRDLKLRNILDPEKLKIVINKCVKVNGVNEKVLIGGMSVYNDPGMTYMTELFNRDKIKYATIPFEEQIYANYLENLIRCKISYKGSSKKFITSLNNLGNMVYPLISGKKIKNNDRVSNDNFSENINNALMKMKNNKK